MSPIVATMLVLVATGMVAVGWRFLALRSKGFPVVVRDLPSPEGRHWRHGVLICSGTTARLFKVRSLRPMADALLSRSNTEILSRRQPVGAERQILEDGVHIVELAAGGKHLELAIPQQVDTALVAWLESCPSERRVVLSRGFRQSR